MTTSTLRNPVFRILTPGMYDIYLTASFFATGQTAMANQKGIEVFDVPTALFEMRPNPLYVPDTELQTFNQSARASLYQWDFDDGTTSEEFEPRHLYKLDGNYTITLVAGFDYGDKDVDGDGILDGHVICYDTAKHELQALDGGYIKLPNAFTPTRQDQRVEYPGTEHLMMCSCPLHGELKNSRWRYLIAGVIYFLKATIEMLDGMDMIEKEG